MASRFKLVSNRLFYWGEIPGTAWKSSQEISLLFTLHDGYIFEYLPGLVIDGRNGPGRPSNIRPPDLQMVQLLAIYGSEIIEIPIQVTHTLNPTYEQEIQQYLQAQAESERRRREIQTAIRIVTGVLICGAVILFLVAVGIIWRVARFVLHLVMRRRPIRGK